LALSVQYVTNTWLRIYGQNRSNPIENELEEPNNENE